MAENDMEFLPLHFADKIRIVNPHAQLGIVTLWSKTDYVESALRDAQIDLDPETSKIAVIGNLYGNGIPHLIRNLLYNPQIRDIIICGSDRSGSASELVAFFEDGIEESQSLGESVIKIRGTSRVIDPFISPDLFSSKPVFHRFGEIRNSISDIKAAIDSFSPKLMADSSRIEIELPEVTVSRYPSEPRNHNIVAQTPLEAWQELVFRLVRFGHLVQLRKGDRQELQNVRVVITTPQTDSPDDLAKFGFSIESLENYQKDMLAGPLPADQPYTYGNRIREYFGFDSLKTFAERLKANPQDRDCYLALWDSHKDVQADDAPCLVSLFFRVFDGKLTLTACYRTHNALDAWLKNIYGLMKAQEIVASEIALEVGAITIISHSISVDPAKYDFAQRICGTRGFSLNFDPNGQFAISLEDREIVIRHMSDDGIQIGEYRSKKAELIQHELARDMAISDINHALYIGRQLARAESCLLRNEPFEEL